MATAGHPEARLISETEGTFVTFLAFNNLLM